MTSTLIRSKFLLFFEKRGHAILDSASIVTKDEKGAVNSTLFNTAGVQPIIPYILGESHPRGKRLASAQKCLRTTDIEDVGDNTHLTSFEMLGNWSLGDYFKEEAIKWSYEFLTDKKEGLGLDPKRLYITVFAGDQNAERDNEAFQIWKKYIPESRIYFKGADSNWWPAVKDYSKDTWSGPTGPCTEMFYDINGDLGDLSIDEYNKADSEQRVVEIWNDVFMQFEKKDGKIIGKLKNPVVDTGAGLERLTTVINNKKSVYDTDLFVDIIDLIKKNSDEYNDRSARIVADHLRASVLLISAGVIPSNTDRGYVLRRLIRRAIRHTDTISQKTDLISKVSEIYSSNLGLDIFSIEKVLKDEASQFRKTLKSGLKEFEKISKDNISGSDAFKLFSTFGFPLELTLELAREKSISVDTDGYLTELARHQQTSRQGAEQKFKGGLGGTGEQEIKYHTATHLLHQALRDVLGPDVSQKGSNITSERLRFDFSYPQKMTDEQKIAVESIVNAKIKESLPVNVVTLPKSEAEKTGALHFFGDKYGDNVTVYYIGNDFKSAYSKEFCGGPHVKNTSELGHFKIQKEEAVSAGVRRIKATLE